MLRAFFAVAVAGEMNFGNNVDSLVAVGILVILPWHWLRRRRFESGMNE